MAALLQRLARQREGGAVRSADQLYHHIGLFVPGEPAGVIDPIEARDVDAAILGAIACRYGDDLDLPPGAPRDQRAVRVEQLDHAGAYRAQAGDRNAQRFGHASPRSEEHTSELQSLMRNPYAV